ncbi:MAG: hypothetical protein KDA90_06925 [Planctomycetaceae bacterium]|nr:hypothetical protein [Planctomycetaceae bacterium]
MRFRLRRNTKILMGSQFTYYFTLLAPRPKRWSSTEKTASKSRVGPPLLPCESSLLSRAAGESYSTSTSAQHATYVTALNTANDSFNTNVTSAHIAAVTTAAASTLNLSTTTASHTQQLANLQGTQQASLQLAEQQALASNLQSQSATSPYHQHASDVAGAKAQQLSDSAAAQESHRETVTQAAKDKSDAASQAQQNYTVSTAPASAPTVEPMAPEDLPAVPESPPVISAATRPDEYEQTNSTTFASAAFNSLSSMASHIWSAGSELLGLFNWGQDNQTATLAVNAQDPSSQHKEAFDQPAHIELTTSDNILGFWSETQEVGFERQGHHWVPVSVFYEYFTEGEVFTWLNKQTAVPAYYKHAGDRWNGVSHGEYTEAFREIFEDAHKRITDAEKAEQFIRDFETLADNEKAYRKFAQKWKIKWSDDVYDSFKTLTRWRDGFLAAELASHFIAEYHDLTEDQMKMVLQAIDDPKATPIEAITDRKVRAALEWHRDLKLASEEGQKLAKSVFSKLKKGGRVLGVLAGTAFFFMDAADAYAGFDGTGEIHTRKNIPFTGVIGAYLEWSYQTAGGTLSEEAIKALLEESFRETARGQDLTIQRETQMMNDIPEGKYEGELRRRTKTPQPKTAEETRSWYEFFFGTSD